VRSFLAVAVEEPALAAACRLLARLAARLPPGDCRWVRGEGLHLTLHFFGELDEGRVGEVLASVSPAAAAAVPFHVALGGLGSFPPRGEPRVLWIGVQDGTDPLGALARDCRHRLSEAGFPVEDRPYRPHCTLGRPVAGWSAAAGAAWAASVAEEAALPSFRAGRLTLFRSRPEPGGARYSAVAGLPLGGS
jgi:RNA 2',3'-cyclic 3'-phosphodiesterase